MKPFVALATLVLLASCNADQPARVKGCGVDARYRAVERLIRAGDARRRAEDIAAADALYDQGLAQLGGRYFARDVIDGTGEVLMSLKVDAPPEPSAGRTAAKGRILASRLRLYRDEADPEACF